MKLSSSFSVPEESNRVFELFLDAPTMRACIPGCQELVRVDDTHYSGRLVDEIAHVRFDAAFSVEIVGMEMPHEVRALLKGEDRRLASSLKLNAVLQVRPDDAASMVNYSMEIAMWGKLGRMGESIFRRRIAEVERQFVQEFTRACASGTELLLSPAGPVALVNATDANAGASPSVAVRIRPTTSAPSPRPAYSKRVPWWHRVKAWFSGRSRRVGNR